MHKVSDPRKHMHMHMDRMIIPGYESLLPGRQSTHAKHTHAGCAALKNQPRALTPDVTPLPPRRSRHGEEPARKHMHMDRMMPGYESPLPGRQSINQIKNPHKATHTRAEEKPHPSATSGVANPASRSDTGLGRCKSQL